MSTNPRKTVSVQIVCRNPECRHVFRTRLRGRSTTCPACKKGRYVGVNQQHEGPGPASAERGREAATVRAPVPLRCGQCAHRWESQAARGSTVRCPKCRSAHRVTKADEEGRGVRSTSTPAPHRPPAPAPAAGPAPAPAPRPAPAAAATLVRDPDDEDEDEDAPYTAEELRRDEMFRAVEQHDAEQKSPHTEYGDMNEFRWAKCHDCDWSWEYKTLGQIVGGFFSRLVKGK